MICMKNLRFYSCPVTKLGTRGHWALLEHRPGQNVQTIKWSQILCPTSNKNYQPLGGHYFSAYSIHSHELKTDFNFIWWCMFFSSCLPRCKCVPCFKNLMYLTCITMPNLPPMMTRQKPQNVSTFCRHFPNTLEGWKKKLLIWNQEHGRKITRTFNQLGI